MSWECLTAEDSRGITGVLTPALSLLCRGVAVVYIPSPRSMALKIYIYMAGFEQKFWQRSDLKDFYCPRNVGHICGFWKEKINLHPRGL